MKTREKRFNQWVLGGGRNKRSSDPKFISRVLIWGLSLDKWRTEKGPKSRIIKQSYRSPRREGWSGTADSETLIFKPSALMENDLGKVCQSSQTFLEWLPHLYTWAAGGLYWRRHMYSEVLYPTLRHPELQGEKWVLLIRSSSQAPVTLWAQMEQ